MSTLPALRVRSESFRLTTADVVALAGTDTGIRDNDRFEYVVSQPNVKSALLVSRLRPAGDVEVLSRRGSHRAYIFAFDGPNEEDLLGYLAFTGLLARDSRGHASYDLAIHDIVAARPAQFARAATALAAALCRTVLVDLESLHAAAGPEIFVNLAHTQSLNYRIMEDTAPAQRACERIAVLFRDTIARLAVTPREEAVVAA